MRPQARYEIAVGDEDRKYEYELDPNTGKVINFREKGDDGGEPKGSKENPITG